VYFTAVWRKKSASNVILLVEIFLVIGHTKAAACVSVDITRIIGLQFRCLCSVHMPLNRTARNWIISTTKFHKIGRALRHRITCNAPFSSSFTDTYCSREYCFNNGRAMSPSAFLQLITLIFKQNGWQNATAQWINQYVY